MRVSIVATALDGHKTENRTVLNMVSEFIIGIQVIQTDYFHKQII